MGEEPYSDEVVKDATRRVLEDRLTRLRTAMQPQLMQRSLILRHQHGFTQLQAGSAIARRRVEELTRGLTGRLAEAVRACDSLKPQHSHFAIWQPMAARQWPPRSDFAVCAAVGAPDLFVVGGKAEPHFELRAARTAWRVMRSAHYSEGGRSGHRVY